MEQSEHIIITERCSNLRFLARQALQGKWKTAIVAAAVYQLCVSIPSVIILQLFGVSNISYNASDLSAGSVALSNLEADLSRMGQAYGLLFLYSLLVAGAFALGVAIFSLAIFRGKAFSVSQVFAGFGQFSKALGLNFMIGLFVFLWMLPVIVVFSFLSGFILSMIGNSAQAAGGAVFLVVVLALAMAVAGILIWLRYSQAFFLLADNPEKGVMQCIRESKQMMKGNVWKLFLLYLSFLGWGILSVLAVSLVSGVLIAVFSLGLTGNSGTDVGGTLITEVIAAFAMGWIVMYMRIASAAFYDILTGNLRAATPLTGGGPVTHLSRQDQIPPTEQEPAAPEQKQPEQPEDPGRRD